MAYNRFLYNTALYNAGREEVAAVATSLIQAHTGPHIQAVVGGTGGVTFISDFVIRDGTRPLPTSFRFPDLPAVIRAQETDVDDLPAYIRGWWAKDLPAAVYLVDRIPDIRATIFGLLQADLAATILGQLAQKDLAAIIEAAGAELAARIFSQYAPDLQAIISGHLPADLGGLIWSPMDLPAYLQPVYFGDLPATATALQFVHLGGQMSGVSAPDLSAYLHVTFPGTADLPGQSLSIWPGDLPAAVTPSRPGPGDIGAVVSGTGDSSSVGGFVRPLVPDVGDLSAFLRGRGNYGLPAVIQLTSATDIASIIGTIPLNEKDRFLPGYLQPVTPADLGATMTFNENVATLGASILSLRDQQDLAAFIRVDETFVTALLTVSTLASRSLRAVIGNPNCAGGSAIYEMAGLLSAQQASSLGAAIESFIVHNLGASINNDNIFHAFDTISVVFVPFIVSSIDFNATDTISITFSPFRGKDLGATITALLSATSLGASITPTFPLARVVPAVNRLTAADLRLDREQDIQEIRLQLEGTLLEYLYVHGTDQAFIKDPNEDWKINVRSFKPLAEGLFGDHAANRVCRLGSLASYTTLDQAVRACINAVIGYEYESDLGAYLNPTGQLHELSATLGVWNHYGDLGAIANRVYPVDIGATIGAVGVIGDLGAYIRPAVVSGTYSLGAYISQMSDLSLGATISGSGHAEFLGAYIRPFWATSLGGSIEVGFNKRSLLLGGTDEYVTVASLNDLGLGGSPQRFTVAIWVRWDGTTPSTLDTILGASTNASWLDGFGIFWEAGTEPEISFFVNNSVTNKLTGDIAGEPQWTHVVGTYDQSLLSDNLKLYMNGELRDSLTHTAAVGGLNNTLALGRISSADPAASFSTQHIDEFAFWSGVALSGSEVSDIFGYGRIPTHDLTLDLDTYEHADDLTVYYKFEDTYNTFPVVTNTASTGSTYNGTMVHMEYTDSVEFTPSHNSVSMEFPGGTVGAYFTATGTNLPLVEDSTGSFSVAAWANAITGLSNRAVCGMYHLGGDAVGSVPRMRLWHTDVGGPERWEFEMNTTGNAPVAVQDTQNIDLSGATWYFVAATFDSTTKDMKLYVDGTLTASGNLVGDPWRIDEFSIGSARQSGSFTTTTFDGLIDTVAVWDAVLEPDDVAEIYNGGSTETDLMILSTATNLQAWYRLGEAGDTLATLRDRSPNHATMNRNASGNLLSDEVPTT